MLITVNQVWIWISALAFVSFLCFVTAYKVGKSRSDWEAAGIFISTAIGLTFTVLFFIAFVWRLETIGVIP